MSTNKLIFFYARLIYIQLTRLAAIYILNSGTEESFMRQTKLILKSGKTAEGPGSTHDAFYKYSLHVPMKTQLSNAEFLFVPLQISYTLKRTATS